MITSILCDYSDVYILAKGRITVQNTGTPAVPNNRNKNAIFRNFDPFTNCISEINNKEIDHARDIDVVIHMYNLIEYSDSYSKKSASLWQYHRDELFQTMTELLLTFLMILIALHLNINKKLQVKQEMMNKPCSNNSAIKILK